MDCDTLAVAAQLPALCRRPVDYILPFKWLFSAVSLL